VQNGNPDGSAGSLGPNWDMGLRRLSAVRVLSSHRIDSCEVSLNERPSPTSHDGYYAVQESVAQCIVTTSPLFSWR
jgi:hypothetical protein